MKKKSVKQLMEEAYLRLLSKEKYSNITVSSVVKEAGVGRASFYRNFNTTNDILEGLLDQFEKEVIQTGIPFLRNNKEEAQREFCARLVHAIKYGDLMKYHPLQENMDYIFYCLKRRHDIEKLQKTVDTKTMYALIADISIAYACTRLWAKTGYVESEEEMIDIICNLFTKDGK